MLLAERFVLLLLDPQSGELRAPRRAVEIDRLCASGLLIELITHQRLRAQGGDIVADGDLPASHPLLDAAYMALVHQPMPAGQAITAIARRLSPLPQQLCDGLYRRDLLHRERDWRFWRGQRVRYPLRSIQGRNETLAVLREGGQRAHERLLHLGLLMLVDLSGALDRFLSATAYEVAVKQLLDLGRGEQHDEAMHLLAMLRAALIDD